MHTSERGIEMIVAFEGIELTAYRCPAGIWTIGVGHTGSVDGEAIYAGMSITREKALDILQSDLIKIERYIGRQTFVKHLTQGQFDALVSFIFNIGIAAFQSSTMRKILSNTNAFEKAAKEFDRWVYSKVNGKKEKLSGLVKRRNIEKELFLNGK